tara:strand:+ start:173 stop:625 length:453 start_codon:yes stop_codon:yes gene_type:complete
MLNITNIINGGVAVDDRGSVKFVNDFNFDGVKRFYQIENHQRGFIRAWHGHRREGKYVYVAKGSALVGAVNLPCDDDPEYQIILPDLKKFVLSSQTPKVLWIPWGHANGFMTLEENTIIQFFSTRTLEESLDDDIRFPYNKWDIWSIEKR